jgi:hypothetical protein
MYTCGITWDSSENHKCCAQKSYRKIKTHVTFNNPPPDNRVVYEMWGKEHKILRINNQKDASSVQNFILSRNSTCFGHFLCPSSGVISCTRDSWYVSCRLCGRWLGESD